MAGAALQGVVGSDGARYPTLFEDMPYQPSPLASPFARAQASTMFVQLRGQFSGLPIPAHGTPLYLPPAYVPFGRVNTNDIVAFACGAFCRKLLFDASVAEGAREQVHCAPLPLSSVFDWHADSDIVGLDRMFLFFDYLDLNTYVPVGDNVVFGTFSRATIAYAANSPMDCVVDMVSGTLVSDVESPFFTSRCVPTEFFGLQNLFHEDWDDSPPLFLTPASPDGDNVQCWMFGKECSFYSLSEIRTAAVWDEVSDSRRAVLYTPFEYQLAMRLRRAFAGSAFFLTEHAWLNLWAICVHKYHTFGYCRLYDFLDSSIMTLFYAIAVAKEVSFPGSPIDFRDNIWKYDMEEVTVACPMFWPIMAGVIQEIIGEDHITPKKFSFLRRT